MTFEEFFAKKKIDLEQLKQAEPALLEEFRSDFAQMGEKSFDHTKKYWFNKLRRRYHLKTEPKPEPATSATNPLATQAEPLSSPTIVEKAGYTPRFKPRVASQPKTEDTSEKEIKDSYASAEHPVADKNFTPKPDNAEALSVPIPGKEENPTPKPAYKPRFNASVLKNEPEKNEEPATEENITPEKPVTPAKPAYKPRFNAAALKKEPEQGGTPPPDKNETTASHEPAVKPAYKPRFNASLAKKELEPEKPADAAEDITPPDAPEDPPLKPAYKPRFKPAMLKQKPKDDETDQE